MKNSARIAALLALAIATVATAASAADRGYFGFAISVDGDGFFLNPTLRTVTIDKVVPGSPAAKAGIVVGDRVVEVEGRPVAGTKADVLKPYLEREVGQATRLVIRKASGEDVTLVLVAGAKGERR